MSNLGVEGHTSNHSSTMVGLLCRYILDFKKNTITCPPAGGGGGGGAGAPTRYSLYLHLYVSTTW